ncbi:OmpA family protein [Desulfuromonas sp. TF]|uniref:OmpA family protein n=1 Tax=Desulfuromonas sp. TF TaxID=1232410 RepID=UPI0003FB719B|nr:OmpA family protein [Desulfuromonas sp. TF]
MKNNNGIRYCILLAALITMAGCAAGPEENAMLEQARAAYNEARNDPLVMENAPLELAKAEDNLLKAQELWEEKKETARVEHHAYLSRQQSAIARETAQLQKAQQTITEGDAERNRVLLEIRAKEAEAARRQAQLSQAELKEARARAEEQARMAQIRELEESRRQAEEQAKRAEEAGQKVAGLEAELAELKARPTERGMVITLGDVLFDLDKADLNPGANLVMDRLAAFLKDHEERRILVEGFTDSTGAEDYNMQLSERRARSVRQALMDRGIAGDRIEVRGYGEQYPMATNETVAGRQQNRRVEILFSDEEGKLPGRR